MKTIAVDFDGVIHAYSRGWQDGSIYDEPVPGALDAIHALMGQGLAVFVHTTRDPEEVAAWLGNHHLNAVTDFDVQTPRFWDGDGHRVLVTNRKLPAVAYIDDRGIRFETWEQALADLAALERIEVP